MTRGDEDIEGGLSKFLDTRKGGSEKIRGGGGSENLYTSKPTEGGRGSFKIEPVARETAKIFKLRVSISSSLVVILN